MSLHPTAFTDLHAPRPDLEALRTEYERIGRIFDTAQSAQEREACVREWDAKRRETITYVNLTHLHYQQDLANPGFEAERDWLDRNEPKITALDVEMKRRFSTSAHRSELERLFGAHVFATWAAEMASFDPKIEADLVEESKLGAEYTRIVGSAAIEFDGTTHNLAGLDPFMRGADREGRHAAQRARWAFYERHAAEFDRIFDELVRVRTTTARKLGYKSFVELGYQRMRRFDYTAADVERYRDQVVAEIVPLAHAVVRERAARLGLPEAMYWDETMHDAHANPAPVGDDAHTIAAGAETFAAMHPELGAFYQTMLRFGMLDLENRPNKAGGGFCTNFPLAGMPFIFANFNGTEHDVTVLMHEMGHAFQNYSSRHVALVEYLWPTFESAEVHSMSMEYLSFGEMERFFGADAQRYRDHHLAEALLFIPYGCAIDHFQHRVYAQPDASPAQRHAMWQELEERYLPWRQYGDLPFVSKGALWQEKRHVYLLPFYYIDYTLAQCCALQFWARAQADFDGALHDYIALCAKGGTQPFGALIRGANLRSPFEAGALSDVAQRAREALGLSATA